VATSPAQTASLAHLRARLPTLTLRDEHRLRRRADRLRGGADEQALASLAADVAQAETRVARRRAVVPPVTYPPQLPVSERRDDLLAAIGDHQVVIVAGETGSGKTTQLPKLCLELGRGIRGTIAHTQPRRIAARTVAERIASELGVELGTTVGYAVRFTDRTREDTLVRLCTDGLLLAELRRDPLLRRYDTVIVDEAHERSLNVDFLLGSLKRILPQRPDLKVIITSATIDPDRFARHFDGAPVVEVSGRTYPVEVRYRPLDEEDGAPDQTDAIGDAVQELLAEDRGDVLVFLSGEREIRDTAEALAGRLSDAVEILPLYARLAASEQDRVFRRRSAGPRVVLATNVAETSLTVPGIRSVVDPGTARISRYSARLKVQRLPIEAISQASADQRKGRCGRTSDGICVRLYAEDDFDRRERFTDPAILRTSLAAVLLQMAVANLGDIEDFPFLDPPDRRQVRDGLNLLQELRAFDAEQRLTPLGRRLAQLPIDPRLGRMVLEADATGCAEEVVVIAAALSIPDPRERPQEHRAQADQLHARFADGASDFVAFLNLWRHLREQRTTLSGNQFRKRCKAEYLHYLRIREWQDLVAQLREAAKSVDVTFNQQPAEPETIHRALLAGLLSHAGLKDPGRREYAGARGARFALWPGSALARSGPTWVMAAELVETSRLWGRMNAKIEPRWIEPLAEHLLRRTYDEPRWDRRRASVVATERATLYGLPVVAGRTVPYGRIDPVVSRELFLRRALVEGDWDTRHAFLAHNQRTAEAVLALEDRVRRRDLLVDDQQLYELYAARIPETVISGRHFDRWYKDARRRDPAVLTFAPAELTTAAAQGVDDPQGRPTRWKQGELVLPLSYRFEPGAPDDGVTVHVALEDLPRVTRRGFDWLVPALREELFTALIRGLPKELRRKLVPVPETVQAVLERITPRAEPVADALASELERSHGVQVEPAQIAASAAALAPHLRMRFAVEDPKGRELAASHDLAAVREAVKPELRARLAAATRDLERHDLTDWPGGTIPRQVESPGVIAYPALTDEGATVGLRTFETPTAQRAAMHAGTRRLLELTLPSPSRTVQGRLSNATQLSLAAAPHPGGAREVLDDARCAALDALIAEAGGPAWDTAAWTRLSQHVAGRLASRSFELLELTARILEAAQSTRRRLADVPGDRLAPVRRDVAAQLGRLVFPGFVAATGAARLPDVERYLQAAERRLERLPDAAAADLDRMRGVQELEAAYRARREQTGPTPALREVPWLLEELRVSQFAQGVGVRSPVSAKRIRRVLAESV